MRELYPRLSLVVVLALIGCSTSKALTYYFDFSDGTLAYGILSAEDRTVAVEYTDKKICPLASGSIEVPATVTYEGVTYTVTEIADYALTEGRGSRGLEMVTLPSTIKKIGLNAFANCSSLTDVVMGEGIDTIASNAFSRCTMLQGVTLPQSLKHIGSGAFSQCKAITNVVIPDNVDELGEQCFYMCTDLETLVVGNKVKVIPPMAFQECSSLKSLTLGNNVEEIGKYGFAICRQLPGITFPVTLKTLGYGCLENMDALEEINVQQGNPYWKSVDGVLYSADGTTLQKWPAAKYAGNVTIPEGVVQTAISSFDHVESLASVDFPSSFRTLGEATFWLCSNATGFNFKEGLENIDEGAFTQCKSVEKIILPSSTKVIGHSAFYMCEKMASIHLNEGLTTIGNNVFSQCKVLKSITLPTTLDSIGTGLFDGAEVMGDIYVRDGNPVFTSLEGILYKENGKKLVLYPAGRADSEFVVPDVTTEIGEYACENATNLTYVDTGKNVKYIGTYAFKSCFNLETIIIGEECASFGEGPFISGDKITTIKIKSPTPPTFKDNTQMPTRTYKNATLHVPEGCLETYQTTFPWSKYTNIVEEAFSGITETFVDESDLEVIAGEIVVSGDEPAYIEVYSADGRRAYAGMTNIISNLTKGIYIVLINGKPLKVAI